MASSLSLLQPGFKDATLAPMDFNVIHWIIIHNLGYWGLYYPCETLRKADESDRKYTRELEGNTSSGGLVKVIV